MVEESKTESIELFRLGEETLNYYGDIENPIFTLKDICQFFNIDRDSQLIHEVQKNEEYKYLANRKDIIGGRKKVLKSVNEFGLYEIMFRARNEKCARFRLTLMKLIKEIRLNHIQLIKNEYEQTKIQSMEDQKHIDLKDKLIDTRVIQHQLLTPDRLMYKAIIGQFKIIFNTKRNPIIRLNERVKELDDKGIREPMLLYQQLTKSDIIIEQILNE